MTRATHDRIEMATFTVAYVCIGCSAAILQPSTVMTAVLVAFYVLLTPLLSVVAWSTWRAHSQTRLNYRKFVAPATKKGTR